MRERRERVYGPYKFRNRWRVECKRTDGERSVVSFASEAAALKFAADARGEAEGRTVNRAVDLYLEQLANRGRRDSTIETLRHRLKAILQLVERGDLQVRKLTPAVARGYYAARAAKVAPATHHNELRACRTFAGWCVRQGWITADPFAAIETTGAASTGKPQLRIDEARRFLEAALAYRDRDGREAGTAAALALLMGLRASEVTDRVVRDVDDGARVLWVPHAKTRKGIRHLEVPAVLRPRLAELTAGRSGTEPLFGAGANKDWLRYHVVKLTQIAGVPRVTSHGLRGTASSIAVAAAPIGVVAAALGHAGADVTRRHYLAVEAEETGQQRAVLRVLAGGACEDSPDSLHTPSERVA